MCNRATQAARSGAWDYLPSREGTDPGFRRSRTRRGCESEQDQRFGQVTEQKIGDSPGQQERQHRLTQYFERNPQ
jgi:hypothetical protein